MPPAALVFTPDQTRPWDSHDTFTAMPTLQSAFFFKKKGGGTQSEFHKRKLSPLTVFGSKVQHQDKNALMANLVQTNFTDKTDRSFRLTSSYTTGP